MIFASHSKAQHEERQENARLAQLEERGHHKAEVIGSNPIPRICSLPLTKNKHTLIDSWLHQELSKYKWQATKSRNTWYVVRSIIENGKPRAIRLHRYLTNAKQGEIVDHINGNGLDNRVENLRIVNQQKNAWNRKFTKNSKQDKSSLYKGVCKRGCKWRSQIFANGKKIHLGTFNDEVTAAHKYDDSAIKNFGLYAHLNFKGVQK